MVMRMARLLAALCLYIPVIGGMLLPECDMTLPADYLLPRETSIDCGLPSSRSYIFSKFNAVLVADGVISRASIGEDVSIRIRACAVSAREANRLWKDNITIITPTPWTLESCQGTEVNFWGRVFSNNSIHHVQFRPTHTDLTCQWTAQFSVTVADTYSVELMNLWIRASTYSHIDMCDIKKGHAWLGGVRFKPSATADRGSVHIPCGDYCSIFEQCKYFEDRGNGRNGCWMYTDEVTPSLFHNTSKSFTGYAGVRKPEAPAVHLGSIAGDFNGMFNKDSKVCHAQAHVLNSPQTITIEDMMVRNMPQFGRYHNHQFSARDGIAGNDMFCSRGDLPGHWMKWDNSECPKSRDDEVALMLAESVPVASNDMNELTSNLFHARTNTIIYGRRDHPGAAVKYSLSLPTQSSPPWQLYPMCGMGDKTIPPDSVEVVPPKNKAEVTKIKPLTRLSYATRAAPLLGFTWTPTSGECMFRHYSRGQIRKCLSSKAISSIYFSGDSIIGGFNVILKWMIGIQGGLTDEWYLPRLKGEERAIASASVALESSRPAFRVEGIRCVLWDDKNCLKELSHRVSKGPSIYIYNFNIQHIMWGRSAEEFNFHTQRFFSGFRALQESGKVKQGNKFIFVNGMATLGFREPYCTMPRAALFSEIIQVEARKSGWLVLDGYNMTMLRPDMSRDGMHFGDNVNMMMVQMVFGMVCEENS